VVPFQLQPGKTDEAIRIFQDSVTPAHRQRGFKGYLMLTDRNVYKGIAISLWETEADIKAAETSADYQEVMAKFTAVLAVRPGREIYEVSVQV